jgi:CHAT domain-containing protein
MLEVSRRAAELSEGLNDSEELWKAQERAGRALRALGRPAEARQSFLASINTVEAMRREVSGGEQQQQSFLENRLSPWLGVVELLVSQKEYGEALTFAEASKARVLLEYVVSDDATYLFAVTKSAGKSGADVSVYTLPVKREELSKRTEAFRSQLAGRDLGFRATAAGLYELLLKPAEAQLRGKTNVVVAPDGILWDLPFQALVSGANRFLLEDASIAYAPSLTVLREMKRRRKERGAETGPATLLALGNPLPGKEVGSSAAALRGGKLDALPEAEQEVKELGRLYGAARSKVYTAAGEGMIGLSWAMFIAGVPSIVVSQWKVESAGTRELMVSFHRGLISTPAAGASADASSFWGSDSIG